MIPSDAQIESLFNDVGAVFSTDRAKSLILRWTRDATDASGILMPLFPEFAWDGTASHAALIAKSEINSLRAKVQRVEDLVKRLLDTYDCYDDDDLAVKEDVVPSIRAALSGDEK